jgi:hypothetical protein
MRGGKRQANGGKGPAGRRNTLGLRKRARWSDEKIERKGSGRKSRRIRC